MSRWPVKSSGIRTNRLYLEVVTLLRWSKCFPKLEEYLEQITNDELIGLIEKAQEYHLVSTETKQWKLFRRAIVIDYIIKKYPLVKNPYIMECMKLKGAKKK